MYNIYNRMIYKYKNKYKIINTSPNPRDEIIAQKM